MTDTNEAADVRRLCATPAEHCDCVVIGAGVIGLAVASRMAAAGLEVLVLEALSAFGTVTSSRNSEVIHAGIYYPTDSLKAKLCVEGRERLYAFCAEHGVAARRCGKLIVATDQQQLGTLGEIMAQAKRNGVDDLRVLSAAEVTALEPELFTTGALLSPSTGIVDSHGFMTALLGRAEHDGAVLALNAPVTALDLSATPARMHIGGADPMVLSARYVINAAGHGALHLARRSYGLVPENLPTEVLAKGSYFGLNARAPFQRLVYPVPEPGGLGVHVTLDLAGRARFGPDVEWLDAVDADAVDLGVEAGRAEVFYQAIRRYWPALPDDALLPDYAGLRPKIRSGNSICGDFRIDGPEAHGIPGVVNFFGIESPGLTASLALADEAAARLRL